MKTDIPIRLLPIENDGFHLLIRVMVNKKKANMLIDTGASKTVFDKNRINNFVEETKFDLNDKLSTGLGTNTMESHIATIESIRLGDIVISDYNTILLDLSHVNHSYLQLSIDPIDGVIGSDLLKEYNAIIHYGKQLLRLSGPKKSAVPVKAGRKSSVERSAQSRLKTKVKKVKVKAKLKPKKKK